MRKCKTNMELQLNSGVMGFDEVMCAFCGKWLSGERGVQMRLSTKEMEKDEGRCAFTP